MRDEPYTDTEIEAGARALARGCEDPDWLASHRGDAEVVLRATLPAHDARVRADERARVAEKIARAIEAGCRCTETDAWLGKTCDFRRAAAIVGAHATPPTTEEADHAE